MLNYFTGTGKCALSAYRCRFLLFICLGLMRVCLSSSTSGGFSTVLLPARVFARLLIVADWIVMHTDWVLPKTANVKDRKGFINDQLVENPLLSNAWCVIVGIPLILLLYCGINDTSCSPSRKNLVWIGGVTLLVSSHLDHLPGEMCSKPSRLDAFIRHLLLWRSSEATLWAFQMSGLLPPLRKLSH